MHYACNTIKIDVYNSKKFKTQLNSKPVSWPVWLKTQYVYCCNSILAPVTCNGPSVAIAAIINNNGKCSPCTATWQRNKAVELVLHSY